jgi:hypothetical protein
VVLEPILNKIQILISDNSATLARNDFLTKSFTSWFVARFYYKVLHIKRMQLMSFRVYSYCQSVTNDDYDVVLVLNNLISSTNAWVIVSNLVELEVVVSRRIIVELLINVLL